MAGKKLTKAQYIGAIADKADLNKKQVSAVLDAMNEVVVKQLKSTGEATLPGLLKLKIRKKAAVPAGERMDPFKKEMRMFPAKPARKVVKANPVKALKDAVM